MTVQVGVLNFLLLLFAAVAAVLAPKTKAKKIGARLGEFSQARPRAEDRLTPFDAYRAVDAALRECRDLHEQIAVERGPLESMRFGNWTRSTLDAATQARQERTVADLYARLKHWQAVLQDALDIFRPDPGEEPYYLHLIGENNNSSKVARAAIANSTERLRKAQAADYRDPTRATALELAQARATLSLHEGELRECQERARLLSAARQLAATFRRNMVDESCAICTSPSVAAVNRDFSLTTAKHYGFREREFEQHRPHVRQWMLRSRSVGMELVDAAGNRVNRNGRS